MNSLGSVTRHSNAPNHIGSMLADDLEPVELIDLPERRRKSTRLGFKLAMPVIAVGGRVNGHPCNCAMHPCQCVIQRTPDCDCETCR